MQVSLAPFLAAVAGRRFLAVRQRRRAQQIGPVF
jgi:hypothetical protein